MDPLILTGIILLIVLMSKKKTPAPGETTVSIDRALNSAQSHFFTYESAYVNYLSTADNDSLSTAVNSLESAIRELKTAISMMRRAGVNTRDQDNKLRSWEDIFSNIGFSTLDVP